MTSIKITSRDFEITEGIKSKINKEINKIDKYRFQNKHVKVILSNESKNIKKVGIHFTANGGMNIRVEKSGLDLYKEIGKAVLSLENRLNKHHFNRSKGNESIRINNDDEDVDIEEFYLESIV